MSDTAVGIFLGDLVAIALFMYGLHELNSPATARRGNRIAMVGMAIAIAAILVQTGAVGWRAILIGVVVGGAVGIVAAFKVKMTAMPQMVALYNGAGGGAAALIAIVEYFVTQHGGTPLDIVVAISLVLSLVIGSVSFAGSLIAFLKLQELMTGRPVTYVGQQVVNAVILLAILGLGVWFCATLGVEPPGAFIGLVIDRKSVV